MQPIAILASGMVTSVGLNAAASCAAIRCAIDNFSETRFIDRGGEWIIGSQVTLERPWRGLKRLVQIVAPAIKECLTYVGNDLELNMIPLLLCVAEKGRPGRVNGLDDLLFQDIQAELGVRFHSQSAVVARGRPGGAVALDMARSLTSKISSPLCLIAGVDSLLVGATLNAFEKRGRLLTSKNSNGFIPGEAGAAILVGKPGTERDANLICYGIGTGKEPATIESEKPLRGDGMVQAFKAAFAEAGKSFADIDFRISDCNGEQYGFKEAALALMRTLRMRKELFEIWHAADCIGEIGAAAGPCALGIALAAARKAYAPGGGLLCHFGDDDSGRFALVLTKQNGRTE